MTPNNLLEELKIFIEKAVKDIILPVRPVNNKTTPEYKERMKEKEGEEVTHRAADVHLQNLPNKKLQEQLIPYVVLRVLTGKDDQKPGEDPESECKVRVIAVTYSDNDSVGAMDALNVITRIRIALLKSGQVGRFLLRKPLEYLVYEDDTSPYHVAEALLIFEAPTIKREVNLHG